MTASYAYNLKLACKNRGAEWGGYNKGSVVIDGQTFERATDAEDYLESKPRLAEGRLPAIGEEINFDDLIYGDKTA